MWIYVVPTFLLENLSQTYIWWEHFHEQPIFFVKSSSFATLPISVQHFLLSCNSFFPHATLLNDWPLVSNELEIISLNQLRRIPKSFFFIVSLTVDCRIVIILLNLSLLLFTAFSLYWIHVIFLGGRIVLSRWIQILSS